MKGAYRAGHRLPFRLSLVTTLLAAGFALAFGHQGGFLAAQTVSRHLPPRWWESLTALGDVRVLFALFLPFCWRYPRLFWGLVLASLFAGLACRGIKFALPMPRPAAVLPQTQVVVIGQRLLNHSMPAGHAATAFAFAGVLAACVSRRLAGAALLLAAGVAFSRIAVGAHWPLDVLAGAALGLLAAGLALRAIRRWDWGLRPRPFLVLVGMAALATASLPFDDQGYPGTLALRIGCCLWGLSSLLAHFVRAPKAGADWP